MYHQSMQGSNYPSESGFQSSKKKATTPALLFFKSNKDASSKLLTENNSSVLNINRSPMRSSNAKNSLISKSPLLSKSNIIESENRSMGNMIFSKSRNIDHQYQESSIRESIHVCENHENKPAAFVTYIDESNVGYFCEKCAILVASQGYSVEKITEPSVLGESKRVQVSRNPLKNSSISHKPSRSDLLSNSRSLNQSSNNRKMEIDGFLSMTKSLFQQIEYKKEEIKQNLIRSEEFYGQQIEEVNDYFELVYKSLELQKNKCYNYILNQRIQVERPVRLINDTIADLKDKIHGIIQDIQENIETVFQTADQIYRPVIQQYEENYQEISRKIGQIQILQVEMRKIDFQGVPDSIFCISDILKDSIDQNYQIQHQNHLSNQLNSLKQSLRDSLPQLQPRNLFNKKSQVQVLEKKSNTKFCFSFEGEALQAQMEQERSLYHRDE